MMASLPYPLKIVATFVVMSVHALLMLLLAVVTLFRFRDLYSRWLLGSCGRMVLGIWGVRLEIHRDHPLLDGQAVFVTNHTCTLDVFALIAARLPNTRFFLSGFLRKFPQLALFGYLTGIFWTVPQEFPERRTRIFQRACRILAASGESVCLSPEGMIVTSGRIGPFNKGAFHLAAALRAPMQPLYIFVPAAINPGRSWNARAGTIHLHVGRPIDTSDWRPEEAATIKEQVRSIYVTWKRDLDRAHGEAPSGQEALPHAG
jgi:1-acyl-sn-glycerol-3-phosphate acyltransferase